KGVSSIRSRAASSVACRFLSVPPSSGSPSGSGANRPLLISTWLPRDALALIACSFIGSTLLKKKLPEPAPPETAIPPDCAGKPGISFGARRSTVPVTAVAESDPTRWPVVGRVFCSRIGALALWVIEAPELSVSVLSVGKAAGATMVIGPELLLPIVRLSALMSESSDCVRLIAPGVSAPILIGRPLVVGCRFTDGMAVPDLSSGPAIWRLSATTKILLPAETWALTLTVLFAPVPLKETVERAVTGELTLIDGPLTKTFEFCEVTGA